MDSMMNMVSSGVRIGQTARQSIALNMLYPYPSARSRMASKQAIAAAGAAA